MTKSETASSHRMQALMDNIVLPGTCGSNVKKFLHSQDMSYVFKVSRPDKYAHGLLWQNYNHARSEDREKFRQYVIAHRQLTGRTIQKDGRSDGAIYHLDSAFTSIQPKQEDGSE